MCGSSQYIALLRSDGARAHPTRGPEDGKHSPDLLWKPNRYDGSISLRSRARPTRQLYPALRKTEQPTGPLR